MEPWCHQQLCWPFCKKVCSTQKPKLASAKMVNSSFSDSNSKAIRHGSQAFYPLFSIHCRNNQSIVGRIEFDWCGHARGEMPEATNENRGTQNWATEKRTIASERNEWRRDTSRCNHTVTTRDNGGRSKHRDPIVEGNSFAWSRKRSIHLRLESHDRLTGQWFGR